MFNKKRIVSLENQVKHITEQLRELERMVDRHDGALLAGKKSDSPVVLPSEPIPAPTPVLRPLHVRKIKQEKAVDLWTTEPHD